MRSRERMKTLGLERSFGWRLARSPRQLMAGLLGFLAISFIQVSAAQKRMNVVFLVVDDLRPELACYGVEEVVSPNFDRLAEMGMLCERAYVQYPVCNPSRSSFLSGLRPEETGILSNNIPFRQKLGDVVSLPQLFRQNGYRTGGFGKIFHKGQDEEGAPALFKDPLSWDQFYDGLRDVPRAAKQGEGRNLTGGKLVWCEWRAAVGADEEMADGLNTTKALEFLEDVGDQPFFLALGIHKPHDPFIAPKKYFELYPKGETRLAQEPSNRSERVKFSIPAGDGFKDFTDTERKEFKRAYQACVSFADSQIGRVFEAMDRRKLWDDTIVVLVGDHGYHLGEHDWWNKVTVFELGARAPMILWFPGEKAMGQRTSSLIEFVDLYPTLADYAGLKPPHRLSGRTLRPLLDDPTHSIHDAAYTQVTRGKLMGRSVRTDRWRYTEWGESGSKGKELYDHQDQSGEYHNLAGKAAYAEAESILVDLLKKGFPKNP